MKIIAVAVITLDGKIARTSSQLSNWSSKEDKRIFVAATRQAGVMILGNNTFKTLPAPLPGRLHVVITSDTSDKTDIPGQVEYTSATPAEIVTGLAMRGYTEVALTGGTRVFTMFLQAGLIDELWLTLEPVVFGAGLPLFDGVEMDAHWELMSVEQLNREGTLHMRYRIK